MISLAVPSSCVTMFSQLGSCMSQVVRVIGILPDCLLIPVTVSVNPHNPQAQLGFKQCLDALRVMEIVWPSAGRALVLLTGATSVPMPSLPRSLGNNKRSADPSFDDPPDAVQGYSSLRQAYYAPPPSNGTLPQSDVSHQYYYSSPLVSSTMPYSASLSTSALPPVYSTGSVPGSNNMRQDQRYPQYWHDYTPYPPLDSAYNFSAAQGPPQQSPVSPAFLGSQFEHANYNSAYVCSSVPSVLPDIILHR